jgi:hypothetical protein
VRPAIIRLGLVLITLLGYVIAAGCGTIQVTEAPPPTPPPSSVSPAPNTDERHDLGIMAVDFDPALDIERIIANQPISLLIGVENLGNRRENGITVRASLYNGDRTRVLMSDTQRISGVAAGNVKVVRFTHDEAPPRYSEYVLVVDIDPVGRESNTTNNHRTLNISISSSR